jgi:CheY-like chemotaxis protein
MQALKDRPDLILIDITIADVNAFELIGRIKMSSKLKGIPIMIITAYASKQSVQQGIEVGVSDFIVKPMQPAVVLQKIKGKFPARSARKSR